MHFKIQRGVAGWTQVKRRQRGKEDGKKEDEAKGADWFDVRDKEADKELTVWYFGSAVAAHKVRHRRDV